MIVLRSTMETKVAAVREEADAEVRKIARNYYDALSRTTALQKQLSAWVTNEAGNITPQQMAQMFYAQDDEWQAAFFNCMQEEITAYHDSKPAGEFGHPGVPAGEAQWWHMAKHLTDSGFETLDAMHDHAMYHRNKDAAA